MLIPQSLPLLPLPHDLISLVSDHILMKGWNDRKSIAEKVLLEYITSIQPWPVKSRLPHPGYERPYKWTPIGWDRPFWSYSSRSTIDFLKPRPRIDEMIKVQKIRTRSTSE
jgi:hypothetical protein